MQTDVIYNMDALEALRCLPEESVHCCVTSPPYWGSSIRLLQSLPPAKLVPPL